MKYILTIVFPTVASTAWANPKQRSNEGLLGKNTITHKTRLIHLIGVKPRL